MQRFLIFILVVIFTCIVLARLFMGGFEPVDLMSAAGPAHIPVDKPVFDHGAVMLDFTWTQERMVYFCKLLVVVVIVLVAVLNYNTFISEPDEN